MKRIPRLVVAVACLAAVPGRGGGQDARSAVEEGRRIGRREAAFRTPRVAATGDRSGRLLALTNATAQRNRYQYDLADIIYRQLLRAATGAVDDVARLAALGYGQSLLVRWQPDSAARWLRQAEQWAHQAADARTEGEALLSLAPLLGRKGLPDSARVAMERAERLLPMDSPMAAQRLCAQALPLRMVSVRAADSVAQRGLDLAVAAADTAALSRCYLTSAITKEARGQQAESGDRLVLAAQLAVTQGDRDLLANAEQWLAYSSVTYGNNLGAARRYALRAISNARLTRNPITAAWARLNLAQLFLRVGDAASATRAAGEALLDFRRLGDASAESAVLGVQARASVLAGRLEEGIMQYARAESVMVAGGFPLATPVNMIWRSLSLVDLGQLGHAKLVMDSAETRARTGQLDGVVRGTLPYARGRWLLATGDYDAAIASFGRFKAAVRTSAIHDILDADLRIAEAFARSGRLADAESVFTLGSASLERMRARDGARDVQLRLLSGQRYDPDPDVGIATIVNLLAVGGRLEAAFGIAESERARWLWVQRARRIAVGTSARSAELLDERSVGLAEVRAALDERTAVISFVTGRGGEPTTGFVTWRDGARAVTLAPIDSLRREIVRLARLLEGGLPARGPARSLGARLLDDALRVLPPGVTRLLLVPDGQLWHLPFEALVLSSGRHLVERFTVTASPSVRLAVAASVVANGSRVLAFGDAVFDSRFGLARLPGSASEVQAVLRAVGGRGTGYLRGNARREALRRSDWSTVGVVHFATHARVQDFGLLENALYLSGSGDDDGRVGAQDLVDTPMPVALVVLSACRTVGGFVATGEGVQGLVGPVLEAGARAVAVTYWDVRDRSLLPLMEAFYAGMAAGLSVEDALTRAKRALIGRGVAPRTWAALGLVGDGRARPLVRELSDARTNGPDLSRWSHRGAEPLPTTSPRPAARRR